MHSYDSPLADDYIEMLWRMHANATSELEQAWLSKHIDDAARVARVLKARAEKQA